MPLTKRAISPVNVSRHRLPANIRTDELECVANGWLFYFFLKYLFVGTKSSENDLLNNHTVHVDGTEMLTRFASICE